MEARRSHRLARQQGWIMDTDQEGITVTVGNGPVIGDDLHYDEVVDISQGSVLLTQPLTLDAFSLYPNTISSGSFTIADSDWSNVHPSGTLKLQGENADIDVNGVSLMETIRGIQDRLNMLCPDPEMEQEWTELRVLRDQYETKLKECREKSQAWKALQQRG